MSERISRGTFNAEQVKLRNLVIELTGGVTRNKSEISKYTFLVVVLVN